MNPFARFRGFRALLATAFTGLLASAAHAQDDDGGSFDINSVLIATFEADQPFLEPEAERVRRLVESALAQSYVVVTMAEVPPFTDYSAEIYLRSCPRGQYIGCVFVVGGRAETDWTAGGRITAVEGGYRVDMSFIDVSDAKLVLEFSVVLDGSNDAEFQEGVLRIMDALVTGAVQELDVRGDPEAERAARAEAEARAAQARRFAASSIQEDLGDDFDRGDVGLDAYVGGGSSSGRRGGKVRFEDLEEMAEAGGLAPWERAGLTKAQYRLYRNSGRKLRDFKARLQGRKGEVIVRAGLDVTQGPWGQAHATGILLKPGVDPRGTPAAQEIQEQTALQLQTTALSYGGTLELGGGVTPWLEITAFAGLLSSPYSWNFFRESPSTSAEIPLPSVKARTSWLAGAKLGVFPMPAYPARPTLQVGASYWKGSAIGKVVQPLPNVLHAARMQSPNMVLAHIEPGFEVNAGKMITIFARASIAVPITGRYYQRIANEWKPYSRETELVKFYDRGGMFAVEEGNGDTPGRVAPARAFGIGGTVGITLRFRVAGLR